MRGLLGKTLVVSVSFLVLAAISAWLLLSSPILAKYRGDMASRYLSDALGVPIEFREGARVTLGVAPIVHLSGLTVPGGKSDDAAAIVLKHLAFRLSARDLLAGQVRPRNITVEGVQAVLSIDAAGQVSWPAPLSSRKAPAAFSETAEAWIFDFLSGQSVRASDLHVIYTDARNGLEFDLLMTTLELGRADAVSPFTLSGKGQLNDENFSLSGTVPRSDPFKVTADFEQITIALNGTAGNGGYVAGLTATLKMQIDDLGQLLDVLKLQKPVTGYGQISATLKTTNGQSRFDDLDVEIALDSGQSVKVTGTIGALGDPSDVSIDTQIRLYPVGHEPPATRTRRDLELIAVDMSLVAQPSGLPKRRMVITTNGFVLDTGGIGLPPIAVSGIARTPDGLVRLGKVVLRIGPPEAHFLVLKGVVADALRLAGIKADATLTLPAASLLAPEEFQKSEVIGTITGGFHLSGAARQLALSRLKVTTKGTDLWQLDVTGSVGNALRFADVALNMTAKVPSPAKFLTALDLAPIETGPVSLSAHMKRKGTEWTGRGTVSVAESDLSVQVALDAKAQNPVVIGQVESDLIQMGHLRDIVSAAVELSRLDKTSGKTGDAQDADPDAVADLAERANGPFRDVTLRPIGQAMLLSGTDMKIGVELNRITGPKGETSLKTDLEIKDRKARFGPATFDYGGGRFEVNGAMDLDRNPEVLNLSGSTDGWDIGDILHQLRIRKQASGTLHADFEVAGKITSMRDFIHSLEGYATVTMRNGSIDSQLIDIAGLGVFPWLFSDKHGPVAPIVCVRAPLRLSNGRISTRKTAVETDEVQVVLLGDVDLRRKTLDISGQPRPIGKPLSRSPWPFTIEGSLTHPKVNMKDGAKQLRRTDGARTMPKKRRPCVPDIMQLR